MSVVTDEILAEVLWPVRKQVLWCARPSGGPSLAEDDVHRRVLRSVRSVDFAVRRAFDE